MRKSGILLHITSLDSPYGIGTIGKSAFDFIDFLNRSKVNAGKYCLLVIHRLVIHRIRLFRHLLEIHI